MSSGWLWVSPVALSCGHVDLWDQVSGRDREMVGETHLGAAALQLRPGAAGALWTVSSGDTALTPRDWTVRGVPRWTVPSPGPQASVWARVKLPTASAVPTSGVGLVAQGSGKAVVSPRAAASASLRPLFSGRHACASGSFIEVSALNW